MERQSADTDALIAEHLSLPDRMAHTMHNQIRGRVDYEDLQQVGRIALVDAARRYDPDRGVPFRMWAARRIRGAMIDEMRSLTGFSRTHVQRVLAARDAAKASTGTWERLRYTMRLFARPNSQKAIDRHASPRVKIVGGEDAQRIIDSEHTSGPLQDPERQSSDRQQKQVVRRVLKEMLTEERNILTSHYLEGKSLAQLARARGVSRSWLSRLHTRALSRARAHMTGDAEGENSDPDGLA